MLDEIFGRKSRPYYIWAGRWIDSSAGSRCLHFLCHSLNRAGYNAYLVMLDKKVRGQTRTNPMLQTPILTSEIIKMHYMNSLEPIAVYPEDVFGNPLKASTVVRILWMYAGAMGGPKTFEGERIYAFSENIALDYERETGIKPEVIFVPHIDPREFQFVESKKPFQLVYAGKYRSFVGEPPKVGDLESIEIFRNGPKKQELRSKLY